MDIPKAVETEESTNLQSDESNNNDESKSDERTWTVEVIRTTGVKETEELLYKKDFRSSNVSNAKQLATQYVMDECDKGKHHIHNKNQWDTIKDCFSKIFVDRTSIRPNFVYYFIYLIPHALESDNKELTVMQNVLSNSK